MKGVLLALDYHHAVPAPGQVEGGRQARQPAAHQRDIGRNGKCRKIIIRKSYHFTGLKLASAVILQFRLVYATAILYFCKTKIIASRNFNPTPLSYSGC
jgi:hypothetical protein